MSIWFNKAERIPLQLRNDYDFVFGTGEGKKVLTDIIRSSNVLAVAVDMDTNSIVFREGERSVALRMLKILNVGPEEFQNIVEEEIEYG